MPAESSALYAYSDGDPIEERDPLGLDPWAGLTGGVTSSEAQGLAAQAAGEAAAAVSQFINIVAGGDVNGAIVGSGGEGSAGEYYNLGTGQAGYFTSSGAGLSWASSGQSGVGGSAGVFAGVVVGPASSVGGPFQNVNAAIPGTNLSVTAYVNSSGQLVGGAISVGPGIGVTRTNTVTTMYPPACP